MSPKERYTERLLNFDVLYLSEKLILKIILGLTPGRTSDKGNERRSFLWLDGGESDSEGHCQTADGGRT